MSDSTEVAVKVVWCKECKCPDDHSWWCSIGAGEIRAGSRRYFWRD